MNEGLGELRCRRHFLAGLSVNLMSRGFRGISSHFVLRYSTVLLTTVPLLLDCGCFPEI